MSEKKSALISRLSRFSLALAGIVAIGLVLSYTAIVLYPSLIAPIALPMGTPILILGAIVVTVYFGMGIAIAVFAKKYLD